LRASDDRIGHRPAADEPRLTVVKPIEQLFLLVVFDEPHRRTLEAERSELGLVQFEEDIDERIGEAAEVVVFHA
jgi:hypothetical protein